jgi:hypothetical protein
MNEAGDGLHRVEGTYAPPKGVRRTTLSHRKGFERATKDALVQAAEQWKTKRKPPFNVDVKVTYHAVVSVTNPGQIDEYKAVLDPG